MSDSRPNRSGKGAPGRIGTPTSTNRSSLSNVIHSSLREAPSSNSRFGSSVNSSRSSSLNALHSSSRESASSSSSSSSTSSSSASSSRSSGTGIKRKTGIPVNDSLTQTNVTHNERTIKISKTEKIHALKEGFGVDNFADLKPSQRSIVFALLTEESLFAHASSTGTTMEQFIPPQTEMEKAFIRKASKYMSYLDLIIFEAPRLFLPEKLLMAYPFSFSIRSHAIAMAA